MRNDKILAQVADAAGECLDAFDEFEGMADGTDEGYAPLADAATMIASIGAATDNLTFTQLATIGFFSAVSAPEEHLRQALVDFAGFLTVWVAEIDRRTPVKDDEPKAVAA
jgi:hypothetical protein